MARSNLVEANLPLTIAFPPVYWGVYAVVATVVQAALVALLQRYSLLKSAAVAVFLNLGSGLLAWSICALFLARTDIADPIDPNPFGLLVSALAITAVVSASVSVLVWGFIARRNRTGARAIAALAQLIAVPIAGAVILKPSEPYLPLQKAVAANRQDYLVDRICEVTLKRAGEDGPAAVEVRALTDLEPSLQMSSDKHLQASLYLPAYSRFSTREEGKHPLELIFHPVDWKTIFEDWDNSEKDYVEIVDGFSRMPLVQLRASDVIFAGLAAAGARRGTRTGI